MELLSSQLEKIFSVEHDMDSSKDSLRDISMAYGLLLKAAPLQKSPQYSDSLCDEVSPT